MAELLYVTTQQQLDEIVSRAVDRLKEKYSDDSILTVEEFAIAAKMHPVTVRQKLNTGEIKGFKIEKKVMSCKRGKPKKILGRSWRIRRHELRNYTNRCEDVTVEHLHPRG